MSRELAEDPNYWRTAEGEIVHLSDMESSHLFNTMKMLYNHLAEAHELPLVGNYRTYHDFQEAAETDPQRLYRAIVHLGFALQSRTDLSPRKLDAARSMVHSIQLGAATNEALSFALPKGESHGRD